MFLIGAPGVGKSTVSRRLAADLGLYAFQSGQVLRDAAKNGTDADLRGLISARMKKNMPMPVDVYCRLLREHVPRDEGSGIVLDGYPRNLDQCLSIPAVLRAAGIDAGQVIGFVLEAPQDILVARSAVRLVCDTCGQEAQPGGPCCVSPRLKRRPDDAMDQLLARSAQFHERLPSVWDAFAARWPCFAVDASRPRNEVNASIRARLRFALDSVGDR